MENRIRYSLTSTDSTRDDEAHMEVLSNIAKLNKREIRPDLDLLRKGVKVTKSHLELIISDLFKKDYIDSDSAVRDYAITDNGQKILDTYRNQARKFASSVLKLYEAGDDEQLYDLVMNHKDFLWFGYYERFITKDEIKKIAKKLDASIARIWWDKSIQSWGSRYQTS